MSYFSFFFFFAWSLHSPPIPRAVSLFSISEFVSILLVSSVCSLDSTCEWNHMAFVFSDWFISLSITCLVRSLILLLVWDLCYSSPCSLYILHIGFLSAYWKHHGLQPTCSIILASLPSTYPSVTSSNFFKEVFLLHILLALLIFFYNTYSWW